MKYFDSHAHYYDERFESEINESVDDLIDALLNDSVSCIVNIGTSPETSRLAIEQAKRHTNMYTAIGIHPSDTRFLSDIDRELADIESLILDPDNKCVCLGEIGLDYHYDGTDKEKQMEYFERQMLLAEKLSLPVSIHDREAHGDVMDVIRRHPNVKGILHSFSGSVEMAEELVKLGYYISFSGTLTFTNARKPREVAAILPKDKVLIETDCPYLTPHPHRGKINHSGYLSYTNACLASIWGISEDECSRITEENARRVFGI
jgi:TatD DNase family protein